MASASPLLITGLKAWLPEGYLPGPFDVQIGRGRQVKESLGNIWFAELIESVSTMYSAAHTKARKSDILTSQVLAVVNQNGCFLKKDKKSGRYYIVEDSIGRCTSAQAMRDCLRGDYRSSRQFKQGRRSQESEANSVASSASSKGCNSSSSSGSKSRPIVSLSEQSNETTLTPYQSHRTKLSTEVSCSTPSVRAVTATAAVIPEQVSSAVASKSDAECFNILSQVFLGAAALTSSNLTDPLEPEPLLQSRQRRVSTRLSLILEQNFQPISDPELARFDLDEGLF